MKKFNFFLLAVIGLFSFQFSLAQSGSSLCVGGVKGPNLLGDKGTFSSKYITPNLNAAACLQSGSNTYNPVNNIGNAIEKCTGATGSIVPCTDYTYSAENMGMMPEFTYSLVKVMGDNNGSNCLHEAVWQAKDHTGDGGYFLAVNGSPNDTYSPIFYSIKTIPVCIGTTYEFSAYVINMIPGTVSDGSEPNISFIVNGVEIANSGPIAPNMTGTWTKVGGSFTATTSTVDLQVVNATAVAIGNDLGLDDISINVCQSKIAVSGPATTCVGNSISPNFVVTDPQAKNTWYKFEISDNGGASFYDLTTGEEATFGADNTYSLTFPIDEVIEEMHGVIYRLVVSTYYAGLDNPDCIYFNDYKLVIGTDCAALPVKLTTFQGNYSNGIASLNWQTSQEINSDRFELYRSANGNDFNLATTVVAAGNSNTPKNYFYNDHLLGNEGNNVFYKLKQIDKDGKFTFSNIIKLSIKNDKALFQIFPNPAVTSFTTSFSATKAATASLLIRNTNGQTVYSKTVSVINGNNAIVVNIESLKKGMYYVSLVNDDINYNGKLQVQ